MALAAGSREGSQIGGRLSLSRLHSHEEGCFGFISLQFNLSFSEDFDADCLLV